MRIVRAVLIVLGMAGMALAVYGILFGRGTHPAGQFLFLAVMLAVHDLLLLPVAIAVGLLTVRYLPAGVRPAVQSGLYASAVLTALALPFLIGAGRMPENPTVLPLNYGRGLLIVLGVIWAAAAILAVFGWRRARRATAVGAPPGHDAPRHGS